MLPALATRMNRFAASLLVALGWLAWHVPAYVLFGKGDDGAVGDVADVGDGGEFAAEKALEDLFALIDGQVRELGGAAERHEAVQAGGDVEVDVALDDVPEVFAVGIDGPPVGAENSFKLNPC